MASKNKIQVLISTYHNAFLHHGGGEYELTNLAYWLRLNQINVDLYGPYCRSIDSYDLVVHFSIQPSGLEFLRAVKSLQKPIIIWTNIWFSGQPFPREVVEEHINLATFLLFKSEAEKNNFCSLFHVPDEKIKIINAGIDPEFFKSNHQTSLFFNEVYDIKDYALSVGIIEPVKNQLAAIRALKELSVPMVFIGKYRDKDYFMRCKLEAGDNALFIDSIPYKSDLIVSAYENCSFFIELSREPAGLSALSAWASGCKMVISESSWGREHFGSEAVYVDPIHHQSVIGGIRDIQSPDYTHNYKLESIANYQLPHAIYPLIDLINQVTER
jgi:glycosyltransferase involved in cell wall biosynthesis